MEEALASSAPAPEASLHLPQPSSAKPSPSLNLMLIIFQTPNYFLPSWLGLCCALSLGDLLPFALLTDVFGFHAKFEKPYRNPNVGWGRDTFPGSRNAGTSFSHCTYDPMLQ